MYFKEMNKQQPYTQPASRILALWSLNFSTHTFIQDSGSTFGDFTLLLTSFGVQPHKQHLISLSTLEIRKSSKCFNQTRSHELCVMWPWQVYNVLKVHTGEACCHSPLLAAPQSFTHSPSNFLLLCVFVVSTPWIVQTGITVHLPQSRQSNLEATHSGVLACSRVVWRLKVSTSSTVMPPHIWPITASRCVIVRFWPWKWGSSGCLMIWEALGLSTQRGVPPDHFLCFSLVARLIL